MTRRLQLEPVFVDTIPSELEEGRLYISKRYRTAMHRCCCGCGLEVVTPLNPAKWRLTETGATVSLYPSVGNWSFPCQSHYWIEKNEVRWARVMPKWQIDKVRRRDQAAVEALAKPRPPVQVATAPVENRPAWWQRLARWLLGS
jgi:hypothetical protein